MIQFLLWDERNLLGAEMFQQIIAECGHLLTGMFKLLMVANLGTFIK